MYFLNIPDSNEEVPLCQLSNIVMQPPFKKIWYTKHSYHWPRKEGTYVLYTLVPPHTYLMRTTRPLKSIARLGIRIPLFVSSKMRNSHICDPLCSTGLSDLIYWESQIENTET